MCGDSISPAAPPTRDSGLASVRSPECWRLSSYLRIFHLLTEWHGADEHVVGKVGVLQDRRRAPRRAEQPAVHVVFDPIGTGVEAAQFQVAPVRRSMRLDEEAVVEGPPLTNDVRLGGVEAVAVEVA